MKSPSSIRWGRGALLTIVACILAAGPAQGTDTARVVYLSNRAAVPRTFDVIVHDLRTDGELNLTAGRGIAGITSISAPRVLTTRNSIVCIAAGGKDIVELSLAGGPPRSLARGLSIAGGLAVAPDEGAVAFVCRINGKSQICEVDLEGGVVRNLSANAWNDTEIAYAPDGRSIAFVTDRDGSRSIAIMRRDGLGQRVLTNEFGEDRFPCFAPGGERIVFTSSRSARAEGASDLYSIETSGRAFTLLYGNGTTIAHPVLSPDGAICAFVSTNMAKKTGHIMLMDLASGHVRTITGSLPYLKGPPVFSANGRYLVFDHVMVSDCEIMLYDTIADALRDLSNGRSWDCGASF